METFEDTLYPEAGAAILAADAGEALKMAGLVALGAVGGAFTRGTIASLAKNDLLAAGIEAALGVAGAIFGVRQGSSGVTWLAIGYAAHGLADVIAYFLGQTGIVGQGTQGGTTGGGGQGGGSQPPVVAV